MGIKWTLAIFVKINTAFFLSLMFRRVARGFAHPTPLRSRGNGALSGMPLVMRAPTSTDGPSTNRSGVRPWPSPMPKPHSAVARRSWLPRLVLRIVSRSRTCGGNVRRRTPPAVNRHMSVWQGFRSIMPRARTWRAGSMLAEVLLLVARVDPTPGASTSRPMSSGGMAPRLSPLHVIRRRRTI